jgi:hypothetical protein
MTAPRIMLFGDSHAYAMQRAIERREAKGRRVPVAAHRLLKLKNGKEVGDTSFEDFLVMVGKLSPDDVVLSAIGGNQHAVYSTIQHPDPFSFFEPGSSAPIESDVGVIPYRVLEANFAKGIRNGDGISLKALRDATRARVVHLLAPPPKRDNDHILRHHESRFATENIAGLGVSSPQLRMKFWNLQRRILEEFCQEIGIEVLGPPAGTLDEDGYLAAEFYASDATHANVAYGELVLAQADDMVATAETKGRADERSSL